ALERVDARPGKDGVPSGVATHEQIAGDIEQAIGANNGAREVEQGEERRDREGVDEPSAGRIPGCAYRDAKTRREEQLLEGSHGEDEAILDGVIVERRIRDEPEEVVGGREAIGIVSEEEVEVGRGHDGRHRRKLTVGTVRLRPDTQVVVHRLDDISRADRDRTVRRYRQCRALVDTIEAT